MDPPVIVTVRDNKEYIRVFYISSIPRLQGGGPPKIGTVTGRISGMI